MSVSARDSATATTPDAADLAARRAARERGPRLRRWAGGLALLVTAGAVVWAVWFSPLLSVHAVKVVGAEQLDPQRVIAVAGVPEGTPLARVDVAAVAARVQALPRVASVEVRRGYPHDLVLAVVERTPLAVVRAGSAFEVVDVEGVRFARARTAAGLAVLVADDDAGVRAGLDVLASLPDRVRTGVVSVTATSRDDVTLALRSGARVRWGDASRSERKAQVLAALLARRASVYDVSAPDLPTTTP